MSPTVAICMARTPESSSPFITSDEQQGVLGTYSTLFLLSFQAATFVMTILLLFRTQLSVTLTLMLANTWHSMLGIPGPMSCSASSEGS